MFLFIIIMKGGRNFELKWVSEYVFSPDWYARCRM